VTIERVIRKVVSINDVVPWLSEMVFVDGCH